MSALATETTTLAAADVEAALELFLAERTRLFRIAHRVTGDIGSAEDLVQETWVRWQRTDRSAIKNPAAFLTTAITHLAINLIQSARCRHEASFESPLALLADVDDPTRYAEQTSGVEETLLVLMAKLRPAELAAYLLRKSFDYPYADIAALLRTSTTNARQLVRRAQQRFDGDQERDVAPDAHRELVAAFLAAARRGDLADLEWLLSKGAVGCPRQRPRRRAA
jgi:RNA polymerase sigma-70 factor (ECF subfamily)